jgi:hypothetical protein
VAVLDAYRDQGRQAHQAPSRPNRLEVDHHRHCDGGEVRPRSYAGRAAKDPARSHWAAGAD